MPTFDYIASKEFRESLETDYAEMRKCIDAEAWKSAQVLSGSIVEALLVDYLAATTNANRKIKDPLKTDLGQAIEICQDEKVISERTANLCSVVRSYRNLIHPGRIVRLAEKAPDKASSSVALALVDMITEELAVFRRATAGLVAEQLLSKIERDENSLTILHHLIQEVSEAQRQRLLIELIPAAHTQSSQDDDPFANTSGRLEKAYRIILDLESEEVRTRVAQEFVRILREEDGANVLRYGAAFFQPGDIRYLSGQHKVMVIEHLLARVGTSHNSPSLRLVKGISSFLDAKDVVAWIDPYVRTIISTTINDGLKQRAREQLLNESILTGKDIDNRIAKRLDEWILHNDKYKSSEKVNILRKLKQDIDEWNIPF